MSAVPRTKRAPDLQQRRSFGSRRVRFHYESARTLKNVFYAPTAPFLLFRLRTCFSSIHRRTSADSRNARRVSSSSSSLLQKNQVVRAVRKALRLGPRRESSTPRKSVSRSRRRDHRSSAPLDQTTLDKAPDPATTEAGVRPRRARLDAEFCTRPRVAWGCGKYPARRPRRRHEHLRGTASPTNSVRRARRVRAAAVGRLGSKHGRRRV